MKNWKPSELIIHQAVVNDPIAKNILHQCQGVPTKIVDNRLPKTVTQASEIMQSASTMLEKILVGKQIMFIAPAGKVVDVFTMPDDRLMCPHFDRLKLASNGCFYQCDWCYLKLTYRAAYPFITVRVGYDLIKKQIQKRLLQTPEESVFFNSGELADSLSMEHLTKAGREFIPWFAGSGNGYLFMLTKSGNVDHILNLDHNGHTVIAWSINNALVSKKFEIGAPTFERRIKAAQKVQAAGYPVRIRLDPIVPIKGWREAYANTVREIFSHVSPERMTLGTLRFENGFHKMRNSIFTSGPELPALLDQMSPMFEPKVFQGSKRPKIGKYSFSEEERGDIFRFIIGEIRKYSECKIALCKESVSVWKKTGLQLSKCSCACQLDYADMASETQI